MIATSLGTDPSDQATSETVPQTIHEKETGSCPGLAAPAASIRVSFDSLLETVKRRRKGESREVMILAPATAILGPRQPPFDRATSFHSFTRATLAEAALIDQDDRLPLAAGASLVRGLTFDFRASITISSRSIARPIGRCGVQSRRCCTR
jgi:hypothetical protein